MAIEELYFGANVRTAFAVGQARGVVLLAAGQRGVPSRSYTPQQVKGAVCGNGRADKDQVARMVARLLGLRRAADARPRRRRAGGRDLRPQPGAAGRRAGRRRRGAAMIALISGTVAVRRADHVVVDCGGVGYRLAVSAETLRQVPAVGRGRPAHPPGRPRRRAGAVRVRHRGGARAVPDAARRPVGRAQGRARGPLGRRRRGSCWRARRGRRLAPLQAVPGVGKRTAERIIVELREKVGATLPERRDLDHPQR